MAKRPTEQLRYTEHEKDIGVVLSRAVLYLLSKQLITYREAVILGKVQQFDNDFGCVASNNYLADVLFLPRETVSRSISALVSAGYLNAEYVQSGRQCKGRKLTLNIINWPRAVSSDAPSLPPSDAPSLGGSDKTTLLGSDNLSPKYKQVNIKPSNLGEGGNKSGNYDSGEADSLRSDTRSTQATSDLERIKKRLLDLYTYKTETDTLITTISRLLDQTTKEEIFGAVEEYSKYAAVFKSDCIKFIPHSLERFLKSPHFEKALAVTRATDKETREELTALWWGNVDADKWGKRRAAQRAQKDAETRRDLIGTATLYINRLALGDDPEAVYAEFGATPAGKDLEARAKFMEAFRAARQNQTK